METQLPSWNNLIELHEWKGGSRTGLFPYLNHLSLLQSLHQVLRLGRRLPRQLPLPAQLPWKKKPKWVPLRSVFLIRSNLDGTYLRRPLPTIVVLRKPMIVEGVTDDARVTYDYGGGQQSQSKAGLSSPTHIHKWTPASNKRYHHVPKGKVTTFTRKLGQESPLRVPSTSHMCWTLRALVQRLIPMRFAFRESINGRPPSFLSLGPVASSSRSSVP